MSYMSYASPRHPLGLVLALVFAAGCAPEQSGDEADSQDNAVRGEVDTTRAKSVGQLNIMHVPAVGDSPYTRDYHYCTGTLVGPRIVVTAPRCFIRRNISWEPHGSYTMHALFSLGPRYRSADMEALQAGEGNVADVAVIVPAVLEHASSDAKLDNSIAIVRLTADVVGGEPLKLAAPPAKGTPVSLWGYGCAEGISATDGEELRSLRSNWGDWRGWFGKPFSCPVQHGGLEPRPGDLGAAVLDTQGRLVGVSAKHDAVLPLDDDRRAAIQGALL